MKVGFHWKFATQKQILKSEIWGLHMLSAVQAPEDFHWEASETGIRGRHSKELTKGLSKISKYIVQTLFSSGTYM